MTEILEPTDIRDSNDQIIISYSELTKWQTCKRQYYYRYVLDRIKPEMPDAVDTGIKGHKLLQTFYELIKLGTDKEKARDIVREQANSLMRVSQFPDKNLLKSWTLVDNYINANNFVANAFLIENRFLIPASKLMTPHQATEDWPPGFTWSNVLIGFTPDIVFERKGPRYDVEDSKFVQRAWSENKIDRFQQTKLYQIFLETMGYNISRTTLRMFNVATAKITAKNYVMNTAEKETLKRDFLAEVKELVEYKRQSDLTKSFAPRTMNYTSCQFCDFVFVCGAQAEGKNVDRTLQSMYIGSDYNYNT